MEATIDKNEVRQWKRYPEYVNVKTETISELPPHWKLSRLKYSTDINSEVLTDSTDPDYEIEYVDIGSVDSQGNIHELQTMRFENSPSRARRIVRHGDVIVSTVRTYLKAIAAIENPPENLIVSTGFAVLRANDECHPKFLSRLVHAKEFVDMVVNHSEGVGYPAINPTELATLPLWLPPLEEQQAIAAFLDRETARIDALIGHKERLIALLEEKRQAVISHAVTRGLDPNAKMKDSKVQWIGNVPKHWEIKAIRRLGQVQNGLNIGGEAFGSGDPFVSYGDVYNNANIPEFPSGLVESTREDQSRFSLNAGDVLFTRTSETIDDIGIASTCLNHIPHATFAGFLIRFRPNDGILDPSYSTHLFRNQGVQRHFAGITNIVTRASLSQDLLKQLPVCVPPRNEQQEIADFISRRSVSFDRLTAECQRSIGLLQEYRTALISAAVTGQIDVREEATAQNG